MKQKTSIYWLLASASVVYQFCVPTLRAQAIEVIEIEGEVIELRTNVRIRRNVRNTRSGRNIMIGDILDPSSSIRLESCDASLTLRCKNGQRRVLSTNSSDGQVVTLSSICHLPGQGGNGNYDDGGDGNYDDSVPNLMDYGTPDSGSGGAR